MRLIFIRHGDPDYTIDSLTPKGEREAVALQRRVKKWMTFASYASGKAGGGAPISPDTYDFFVSPLGRAIRTAEIALLGTGREAEVLPWLQEFFYRVKDPVTGQDRIAWDWLPAWFAQKEQLPLKDPDEWTNTAVMQSGDIAKYYKMVCDGLDAVLARYGYTPDSTLPGVYRTDGTHCQGYLLEKSTQTYKEWHDGRVAVFFCHLGVMFAAISHLLAMSPVVLWQSCFVAPTSLTILASEEREPGTAAFRIQALSDTEHLHDAEEDISASGYFTDVFAL